MLLFLIPPSEGKTIGGNSLDCSRTFNMDIPIQIALQAGEKDLKCTGKRFHEAKHYHNTLYTQKTLPAIERYAGVMYKAIGYGSLPLETQRVCNQQIFIISGLWGLLTITDTIPNYKLPITTKGLYAFRGKQIQTRLLEYSKKNHVTGIIDLLSGPYRKIFSPRQFTQQGIAWTELQFLKKKKDTWKKLTHGVKTVKGKWIREICMRQDFSIDSRSNYLPEDIRMQHVTYD